MLLDNRMMSDEKIVIVDLLPKGEYSREKTNKKYFVYKVRLL